MPCRATKQKPYYHLLFFHKFSSKALYDTLDYGNDQAVPTHLLRPYYKPRAQQMLSQFILHSLCNDRNFFPRMENREMNI